MKNIYKYIVTALMLLMISGCGKKNNDKDIIIMNTTIITLVILIGKILFEKALHSIIGENVLDEKYEKKEYQSEKPKAKKKLSIYF